MKSSIILFASLILLFTEVLAADSLLATATHKCLQKMDLNFFKTRENKLQFWQVWGNMEFVTLLDSLTSTSKLIPEDLKVEAIMRVSTLWTIFEVQSHLNVPCYFKDTEFSNNTDFWDPQNLVIIWDDRQWMGLSYLELYHRFGKYFSDTKKYLTVAQELYKMMINKNANPSDSGYRGMQWKPKTDYRNTITNTQFLLFCARLYHITGDKQYLKSLEIQYKFLFEQPGKYINCNNQGLFSDGPSDDQFYSYNQGMGLEALAYMAVFTPNNASVYINQIARMMNGFIRYFRLEGSPKYIMREIREGSAGDLTTRGIFRSMLFRHIIRTKLVFQQNNVAHYWQQLVEIVPLLRISLLDNFQAMCKFENSSNIPTHWEEDTGIVNYFNQFGQMHVLYAGNYLFNLKELVIEGIEMSCQGVLSMQFAPQIQVVRLYLLQIDQKKGQYVHKLPPYSLNTGLTSLNNLLDEQICKADNNRNIMTLEVVYKNRDSVMYTLVHLQYGHSKFALIPDLTGEQVINNFGARISSDCRNNSKVYTSKSKNSKLTLSSQRTDCNTTSNIELYIE